MDIITMGHLPQSGAEHFAWSLMIAKSQILLTSKPEVKYLRLNRLWHTWCNVWAPQAIDQLNDVILVQSIGTVTYMHICLVQHMHVQCTSTVCSLKCRSVYIMSSVSLQASTVATYTCIWKITLITLSIFHISCNWIGSSATGSTYMYHIMITVLSISTDRHTVWQYSIHTYTCTAQTDS